MTYSVGAIYPRAADHPPGGYTPALVDLTARGIAEGMWERLGLLGLRSRAYGMHPQWSQISGADQNGYRDLAHIGLDAVKALAGQHGGPTPALAFAKAIYAAVEAHNVANGSPHPGLGYRATWDREPAALRGDWLAIAESAMTFVRHARRTDRVKAMLTVTCEVA